MCRPQTRRSVVVCDALDVGGRSPTEPQAWYEMMNMLKERGVSMINPHEVPISQEKGIPLIDVRTTEQFEQVCFITHNFGAMHIL
jgi:hypothetical protein